MKKIKSILLLLLFPILLVAQGVDYYNLPSSPPINYTGVSGITIENLQFTNGSGLNIELTNCSNITIKNCYLGASYDAAIEIENCSNITIEYNLFANNRAMVYGYQTTGGIKIRYNEFVNVTSSSRYGQFVQLNDCSGAGNEIHSNRGENFWAESNPEDLINIYETDNSSGSPMLIYDNIFRGGGPSGSGGGILVGDHGGSYFNVYNNKLVSPGNYGLAIAGGTFVNYEDNQVFQAQRPGRSFGGDVGFYIWAQAGATCSNIYTDGNKINWTTTSGGNNPWWDAGNCGTTGLYTNNTEGQSLPSMSIPDPLITFVTEDQLWHIRNDYYPVPGLTRPTANAGSDQIISTTTATLSGSGGTTYRWVQVSGPNTATMSASTAATNNLSSLIDGTYLFRLEVTSSVSSEPASAADWVTVTKSSGSSNTYILYKN